MGQITIPTRADIVLTATDRLVARNADGGLSAAAQNVILLGENSGRNLAISQIIGLGRNAVGGSGAGLADTNLVGTIAIGDNALAAVIDAGNATTRRGIIAIGRNALAAMQFGQGSVVIGDNAFPDAIGVSGGQFDRNVMIGAESGIGQLNSLTFTLRDNVIIGNDTLNKASGAAANSLDVFDNVILGSAACNNINSSAVGNISLGSCVIIGSQACPNVGQSGGTAFVNNTILGRAACQTMVGGSDNVLIGTDILPTGETTSTTAIGANIRGSGAPSGLPDRSVYVGRDIVSPRGAGPNVRNVFFGYGCNASAQSYTDVLLIETVDAGTKRTIAFGGFLTGNLVVGNSTQGTDRDFDGAASRNILKLLNGVVGALAPVGGGYFYVSAGLLHWVTSTGVDRTLTPAGQLAAQVGAAYTNNAGVAAGTLLNSPAAGDPTAWIPINDNGTIRNIPAW